MARGTVYKHRIVDGAVSPVFLINKDYKFL